MRFYLFILSFLLAGSLTADAQRRSKKPAPLGEQVLVNKLVAALQAKDAYAYQALFPEGDTVTKLLMLYADSSSRIFNDAAWMQNNPAEIMRADSHYNAALRASFDTLISRGEKEYHIRWDAVSLLRYELKKARTTRNSLYEKLAPTRFYGYVFITDHSSRKTYVLTAGDIMEIKGGWYGGQVKHIFRGSTVDEYEEGLAQWLKKKRLADMSPRYVRGPGKAPGTDTAAVDAEGDPVAGETPVDTLENTASRKDVAERKFYSGMFDNEIPVQLYIRTLRGGCADGSDGNCLYDAIYRFGDQDEYIKLDVVHLANGKWELTEDPADGAMELELKDGKLTGSWTGSDGVTGYDVRLTEMPASEKKIKRLDDIMLHEEWAK